MRKKFKTVFPIVLFLILLFQIASKLSTALIQSRTSCNSNLAWDIQIPGFLFYPLWIILILVLFKKLFEATSKPAEFGYLFIIGGALSNMFERIVYGCVFDYIQIFSWFPLFNIADIFITIGAIIIISQKSPEL